MDVVHGGAGEPCSEEFGVELLDVMGSELGKRDAPQADLHMGEQLTVASPRALADGWLDARMPTVNPRLHGHVLVRGGQDTVGLFLLGFCELGRDFLARLA